MPNLVIKNNAFYFIALLAISWSFCECQRWPYCDEPCTEGSTDPGFKKERHRFSRVCFGLQRGVSVCTRLNMEGIQCGRHSLPV